MSTAGPAADAVSRGLSANVHTHAHAFVGRVRRRRSLPRARRRSLCARRGPRGRRDADVLDRLDAGRLPEGGRRDLSIDSDGRVFLGPSTALVAETSAPFLWTVLAGADGTLWAGTGNEGQVLKIAQDGKIVDVLRRAGARSPRASRRRRAAASTSPPRPTARSTRSRADGTAKTFFDPDDKYIWALARRSRRATLFAATGDKGVIYKITPDGKGARFYKTNADQRRRRWRSTRPAI